MASKRKPTKRKSNTEQLLEQLLVEIQGLRRDIQAGQQDRAAPPPYAPVPYEPSPVPFLPQPWQPKQPCVPPPPWQPKQPFVSPHRYVTPEYRWWHFTVDGPPVRPIS